MIVKPFLRSFAGGEIAPEMYGRMDLVKYQTGLAKCLNFIVLPHGPAQRRPGFKFTNEAKASATAVRLIPFQFSATQSLMLEFGNLYVRFHTGTSTLVETAKAIGSIVGSTVNLNAHGYAVGDWVFIGSRFYIIATASANSFTVTDLAGASVTPVGTTAARAYTLATPYASADLFKLRFAQDSDVLTITHPSYPSKELSRLGATNWTLTDVTFTPPAAPAGAPTLAQVKPSAGTDEDHTYVFTYLSSADGSESLPSPSATIANALNLSGNRNDISWAAVTGATRYNVYKLRGGIYGYIGSTVGTSLRDNNILPDTARTPPEATIDLNGGANDYPSAVTYYEQRRWFAGTNNYPQAVWATRPGTNSNLTSSFPGQEDDALEFGIAARQQNAIRHLLPLSDLIALTVGGEFRIFADNAPAITGTSLTIKPQGYSGASDVQPALTSNSILYVQSQGSRVRELTYSWERQSFGSLDVSLLAPHLFNGHQIVDMAFSRAPLPILWAVRDDGVLLGLTYVPEQQVVAWHQHSTDGMFESVAVTAEGDEDVLYAVVRRTIDGRSVRYVERLNTTVFSDQADAYFVDCGVTFTGSGVTTISNLHHLEGKTVQILTDGAVHPARAVTGGQVTLDYPANVVHIGMAYNSDLLTLPAILEAQGVANGGAGYTRNVNGVAMRVNQSSLVKAGPNFDELTEYPARAITDPYGSPPALRQGQLRFDISPDWNDDGNICVRQDQPLPLTVLSIAADVAIGG